MPVSVAMMIKQMKELLALHRTLLEIGEGKRQAILENRIDDLAALVNRESRVVREMAAAQAAWREAVSRVLAEKGFHPESSLALADIAALVRPGEGREELPEAAGRAAGGDRPGEGSQRTESQADRTIAGIRAIHAGSDGRRRRAGHHLREAVPAERGAGWPCLDEIRRQGLKTPGTPDTRRGWATRPEIETKPMAKGGTSDG